MDRSLRQKINKGTVILTDTLYWTFSIDIFRIFQPREAEYKFFSSTRGTLFKIEHVLGQKIMSENFRRPKSYQETSRSQWYKF